MVKQNPAAPDGPDSADWDEIKRAGAAREQAVRGQESLVTQIQAILFEDDPMGINFGSNTDEYKFEAQLIVIAMTDKPSVDAQTATALVHGVFVHTFGPEIAPASDRYQRSAEQVREVWGRRSRLTNG